MKVKPHNYAAKTVSLAILFGAWIALAFPAVAMDFKIELDREVMPVGEAQTAVVKISVTAPSIVRPVDRPPVNLAVVLDRSGSMQGERIRQARLAAIEALRRLDERDYFTLVAYDSGVETLISAQRPVNQAGMEEVINSIQAGGMTALFSGVSQGAAELRRHIEGDFVHRIILLSDGIANVGPSSPEDLARLGASLGKENITVSTVGLGLGYNEDLMIRLARASDGNAYFVEGAADLPRIFAGELGDVLNVAARRVRLRIDFANQARPLRIIGREGLITERSVEISLNQLYGGQERFVLVEIELPAVGEPVGRLEIARARCDYEDVVSREVRQVQTAAAVGFSADREKVRQSVNQELNRQWAQSNMAIAQEEAIELADRRDLPGAAANFRLRAEELRERGQALGLDFEAEAGELEAQGVQVQSDGIDSRTRKSFRTDSYQRLYQNR